MKRSKGLNISFFKTDTRDSMKGRDKTIIQIIVKVRLTKERAVCNLIFVVLCTEKGNI